MHPNHTSLFLVVLAGALAAPLLHGAEPPAPTQPPFGMRLRKAPSKAPVVVHQAPENEATIVRLKDDTLRIFYIARPEGTQMHSIMSKDNGLTWDAGRREFDLPGSGYHAVQVLQDQDGDLQAIFHVWRGSGRQPGVDRNLDVWHCRTNGGKWTAPVRIFEGYVGSIRGFAQLRGGRLLLPFARAVPERWKAPPAGTPDTGWHNTIIMYSDDKGATWTRSPDELTVTLTAPNATRYGAIEPHVVEMKDGRVWMLIRDRCGFLYESWSDDGSRWSAPKQTRFISSDSPATTVRLADGRLVLFWNACQRWDNPRSYAMGGREVLHAAITADEGATWQGFREVLHDTEPPAVKGDRGAAYPSAVQAADGKIVLISGQGEGARKAIVRFDPEWLTETTAADDFKSGLEQWTLYGVSGTRLVPAPEAGSQVLAVTDTAVWNFPAGSAGKLHLRLRPQPGFKNARIELTDHFAVSADKPPASHAVFSEALAPSQIGGDGWHEVQIEWRAEGDAFLSVAGAAGTKLPRLRAAPNGINYLRLTGDAPGFLVQSATVEITRP